MTIANTMEKAPGQKRNLILLLGVSILAILIISTWYAYTPDGVLDKVDTLGYAVCHRIPSHSFSVDGRPLPLCARCSGMYLGALLGIMIQLTMGKRRGGFSRKWLIILGSLGSVFIIDGLNSFAGLILGSDLLYPAQNWLRLITGMDVGLLISALICPIFIQTAWKTGIPEAALDGVGSALAMVIGALLLVAGVLSGSAYILYPLAILSVLGELVVLTLIYAVLLLMLFKQENRYNHFKVLAPVLLGGLVLTMVQIGLFDLVRYLLTETWSGLPL